MSNKLKLSPLSELFYISTGSINPANYPDIEFVHYSIPAYDAKRSPILEKGSSIKSNKYSINKDSLLVSKLNPRISRVWKVEKGCNKICSTEFIVYQPICDNVNLNFYEQLFKSELFQDELLSLQSGTTGSRMRVTPNTTLSIHVPFPDIKEQQKIASILSSVDAAIEKTEQVIAKTEEVKKGLMQQLLTKGIGHTEFKQTEIGEIPVEWEIKNLVEVAVLTMGQSPSSEDCNEDGQGLVFFQGCSEFGDKYPIPKKYCTNPRKRASKGDILISVRAPVGDLNIAHIECAIGRGLAAIDPINIDRDYLFYYFKLYKDQWQRIQQGSTFSAINKNDLESLLVPCPPKDEQMLIVSKLLTLDKKLEIETEQLDSLQILKKGLMQQLLTGQVRVGSLC